MNGLRDRIIALLRWSEKYTKTDMVYLASGGFWSVFGQASASAIALGLAVVMARYVPKDAYGSYKYILAMISILATFSLSGLGTAVFQSVAHGYRSAVDDGFKANLRWSIFVFLGAFLGGGYYLFQGNATLGIGILIGGCITPFLTGFNLYGSLLSGEKDFKAVAWYSEFVTNIVPAVTIALVAYFAPQPLLLLLAYFIANTAAAGYAYWRAKQKYPDVVKKHDPGMLTYGKHLSAMNILAGIAGNIDQVLLFHFVGPIDLAIYNFAIAIPDQVKGPQKMLDMMMQARFAQRSNRDIKTKMVERVVLLIIAYAAFALLYILLVPFLFSILFPNYINAVYYSQVYAISLLTMGLAPASSYLNIRKRVREQYWNNVLTSVVQICLMCIGVITGGLLGLVWARVATRFFGSVYVYALYMWSVPGV